MTRDEKKNVVWQKEDEDDVNGRAAHGHGTDAVGKLNETVPRRAVPRRALLSGSFSVSVGIEERRRACPFTDGQRDAERRRGGNERES